MEKEILILAYTSDLSQVLQEAQNVSNRINAELLIDATQNELFMTVEKLKAINGIWIVGHLSEDGLLIDGNKALDLNTLKAYFRVIKPSWVLFNGCEGIDVVRQLQQQVHIDIVIPYDRQINDEYATQMASLLALEYVKTGSIKDAVLTVSPDGSIFQYYPSPLLDNIKSEEVTAVVRRVKEMSDLLTGSIDFKRPGMFNVVTKLQKSVDQIKEDQNKMQEQFMEAIFRLNIAVGVLIVLFILEKILEIALQWIQ